MAVKAVAVRKRIEIMILVGEVLVSSIMGSLE